jgi:hypothetical protein
MNQFFKGMKEFGDNITIIINTVLLFFVYLFGVGLSAFFGKLARKKFLDLKPDKNKKSYWEDLNLKKEKIDNYYRQF